MTKVRQLSDIQVNAETEIKQESNLIERKEVENTPFQIVTIEGYSFGVMAEYRITEQYETVEEVEKELQEITWNRIIQITALLIEKLK